MSSTREKKGIPCSGLLSLRRKFPEISVNLTDDEILFYDIYLLGIKPRKMASFRYIELFCSFQRERRFELDLRVKFPCQYVDHVKPKRWYRTKRSLGLREIRE